MKKSFDTAYQFKITLQDIKPPIWRRIRVPASYTFWDLHVAIQDVMGWTDSHLHEFVIKNPKTARKINIGFPDEDFGRKVSEGWKKKITDFFSLQNPKAEYSYDFGDDWRHAVVLEEILPRQKDIDYPLCVDGARACPPEDCGGSHGYEDFLEIIMDPDHEEHDSMLEWVGGEFHPEHFACSQVIFDDPAERLKNLDSDF
ncbi:MAG: plasmid pRiA4b ORF-3 family protein [Nitrospirota bacterium]|nr:plasmid pRiA4b ORF-3 family protein [Nitrospirota bacterium]